MNSRRYSNSLYKTLVISSKILIVLATLVGETRASIEHSVEVREVGGASCHWREIELCCVGTASIFQNPNGVPVTEPEFKRSCEYLDEAANCYENYGERCLTDTQFELVKLFAGTMFDIEKEFCSKGSDMRAQYSKHANCFRDIQKKYQRACVSDLQTALEPINKLEIGPKLSTGCCALNRFKDCLMNKIEDECGSEALDLVQVWLKRAFGNVCNMFCRNYDPQSQMCQQYLPKEGTKPYGGRNTSAISRVVSAYIGVNLVDLS